jgi:hypothetical protein
VIQEKRSNRTREKTQRGVTKFLDVYVPPNDLESEVEKDDRGDKEDRQKVEETINIFKTERTGQAALEAQI